MVRWIKKTVLFYARRQEANDHRVKQDTISGGYNKHERYYNRGPSTSVTSSLRRFGPAEGDSFFALLSFSSTEKESSKPAVSDNVVAARGKRPFKVKTAMQHVTRRKAYRGTGFGRTV